MINERTKINTGEMGGRFEVRVVQSGEIEIYTPDGHLEITPRGGDNVIRVRCAPTWDDITAISIVENIINTEGSYTGAETIVNLLRGRINKSKP